MLEKTLAWWKGLKWYVKYPIAIFVVIALVLLAVGRILLRCNSGLTGRQTQALDDLHRQQVNDHLEQQEADVAESEAETKRLDAVVASHREKLNGIETKARKEDADIVNNAGMSVKEINEWRRRQGR